MRDILRIKDALARIEKMYGENVAAWPAEDARMFRDVAMNYIHDREREQMMLRFKKLRPGVELPTVATPNSVGLDLKASVEEAVTIAPHTWAAIGTGLAVELASDMEMQIRPRSGLAFKHGVTVLNAPGTIDPDYRGEIKVMLVNHGSEGFVVCDGDRIAQAVVGFFPRMIPLEVVEMGDTIRGVGGFGSTGK